MHRVVYEVSDKEIIRVIFNIILLISIFLLMYWRIKSLWIKEKSRVNIKIVLVFLIVDGIISAISMISMLVGYRDIIAAYQNGDYIEIEGVVRNYDHGRGSYETFTLNGVKFECSDGDYGYSRHGGRSLVSGYGRYLRIRYIPGKRRNTIVYIEQLKSK